MNIFSGLLNLLFPPRCVFCRRILGASEKSICAVCEKSLPRTKNGGQQSGDFFSVCVSPLYYEDAVRESILWFKFHDATQYAGTYGALMADCVREYLAGRYDLITWVPLSRVRLKSRGYDQAMLLAMATALKLDDVAVELLKKSVDVPAQSGLGGAETRRANISGVYMAPDEALVRGKRILLIDDIITTGSTISECAKTLRMSGAEDVVCATLARSANR
ncbi:MAG: ComF family protein [Oscillospiraceae bacterium]|jgi:ComF family protein|nr:ComF family protein [Oscillospiraceae bacterium]